ncbi:MAG: hypothetical protein LBU20_00770 [Candidatus Nomurabacteria bacterium]|jgi:hypothetical protein|nr:hypothetical protein [Candidatus Nomurabacteria bacterium]
MRALKPKKPKLKYALLIIIDILVIAAATFVFYDRFFNKPPTRTSNTNQETVASKDRTIAFIGDYITTFGGEQAALETLRQTYPDLEFTSINLAQESNTSQTANDQLTEGLIKDLTIVQIQTFFVNLGATDAAQKVPAESYIENINHLVAKLLPIGAKIILNCPPTINDGRSATDSLLLVYCQKLGEIQTDQVVFGDDSAYAAFKDTKNALLASNSLYPNSAGYQKLGQVWAAAYQKAQPATTPTANQ